MKISKSQSEAVTHYTGPALILAGPGSGKTTVITLRIKYLIENYGVKPSEILVITFTKAAAAEMRERFFGMFERNAPKGVTFGTFHAVFFHILKYAYGFTAENILREEDKQACIRSLIKSQGLETEDENELVQNIISEIGTVKGGMLDLEHYYSTSCSEFGFRDIYRKYDEMLRSRRLLDFDDMLVMTYELFTQRPDILSKWQEKYKYILVDEFQDINLLQYEIVRALARPENNLFAVGDDDQSIYRFRGAKPEIMLNFPKQYPHCKQILLEYNFRCARQIAECAEAVISENKKRFKKKIKPQKSEKGTVILREFETVSNENEMIVKQVRELHDNGIKWSDIAVLFRTNQGARALVEKFIEYEVPFSMKDMLPDIFEHWIAKDFFAYVKMARGNRERSTFLQIMNRPKRYIARDNVGQTVSFDELKRIYGDRDWMLDRIDRLEYDLRVMGEMPPAAAITYFRNGIGYEGYLKDYAKEHRIKEEELTGVLDELKESAKNYKDFEGWFLHIKEYKESLKELRINGRQKGGKKEKDGENSGGENGGAESDVGICIATLHGAKGLEYSTVFIPDVNEGIIPHHKAGLDEDIEEERCMFYVGMTRAKEELYIYYVKERYNKKLEPSRFIEGLLN